MDLGQELRYVLARTYLDGQSENQHSRESLIVLGKVNLENPTRKKNQQSVLDRPGQIANPALQHIPMDYNRRSVSATPFLDEQYLEQDPLLRVFASSCDVRASQRS